MVEYFVGVDVGTGSVRAARVSRSGTLDKISTRPIRTWNPAPHFYEQSSEDIWEACCATIKEVTCDVRPDQIKGLGFDATCSLVALGSQFQPISISRSGLPECNIVMWMDHRASSEAETINQLGHPVLQFVGGKMSLEMQPPKLMWLKKNLAEQCWQNAHHFFDLPDFLTYKATGAISRSLCSVVCKWAYQVDSKGKGAWPGDFFEQIGLSDLSINNWSKIGSEIKMPGSAVGSGLSEETASQLNLLPGTAVATSLIDAHAGTLGMLGCSASDLNPELCARLGLICGTSSCHMAISPQPLFVPGIWGPYFSAVVPDMWLSEGGQSATGRLLDHIVETHPAAPLVKLKLKKQQHLHSYLNDKLKMIAAAKNLTTISKLTEDMHILPDFHGNRSPLADPSMKGMMCGLTLDNDEQNLAVTYLATIQGIAYGTRHIADTLRQHGHMFQASVMCGGLAHNNVFVQTMADVLGFPMLLPAQSESVMLGSAILGACAASTFHSVHDAIQYMGGTAISISPSSQEEAFHEKKYKIFLKMIEDQKCYKKMMII